MEPVKRIVVNTCAQYLRSIINTLLSLYSTRLILSALGVSDYGIYAVIGGVVSMLGFITNALVITTQRYISFQYGKGNIDEVRKYFSNSLFVHVIFIFVLFSVLFFVKDGVIHNLIKIPSERLNAAEQVYMCTVIMLVFSVIIAPYKAVLVAHENIIYISIVEVLDGILKLCLAIYITFSTIDKLILFSIAITFIQFFNLFACAFYAIRKFEECTFLIRKEDISKKYIIQLVGFAGWTTYATGAIMLRTQGIAILLNRFFGTVANAAYGIALQIYGAMSFVSTSVLNAMNPQIIKAEGSGEREKMCKLAMLESKYSSALMMIIAIPVIIEIHSILFFWLKDVPYNTEMFCVFILISFIFDQLTYGLNTVNQALGKIRIYTIFMYTPKLIILPLTWVLLLFGGRAIDVMFFYTIVELFVSLSRLLYMKYRINLDIVKFVKQVIISLIPLAIILSFIGIMFVRLFSFKYRFVITLFVSVFFGFVVFWYFIVSKKERMVLRNFFQSKIK